MDLKRLNHLIALADERNFGRAATRVNLSQPAFSRSIQAAETEMGLQLFDRGNADIACTPAGAFVVQRARKVVMESRQLEREVDLYRNRMMGDLAFGVGAFPAATFLPQLMIDLRTRFPGVNSRVHVNNWRYLVEHLKKEEIDFFVSDIRDVPRDANFSITPIGRQRGRFYVRAGHPLLQRPVVRIADVSPYGLGTGRLPAQAAEGLLKLLGRSEEDGLPVAVECDDIHLLKRITLATDTVMIGTEIIMRHELATGLMKPLELQGLPRMYAQIGVVALRGRSYSPMAEYAVRFMTELSQEQSQAEEDVAAEGGAGAAGRP
ncbi:MAG TPA: LysR family transcriptional regulator [Polaromonas sp.]|uniref:LysR family transcriptional regulator n=1 Tax=Polaromonas sp. TaxID=1869339 RepID=UPI002D420C06|nr:LysR family transcriptional regulator [Polaromonas sp.]HYW56044.1 LysR family transcriptional regulator [Polaromonas sp.]